MNFNCPGFENSFCALIHENVIELYIVSFSLSTARFLKTTHNDMILNFNQYGQLHKYQANIESLSRYSRARYEKTRLQR